MNNKDDEKKEVEKKHITVKQFIIITSIAIVVFFLPILLISLIVTPNIKNRQTHVPKITKSATKSTKAVLDKEQLDVKSTKESKIKQSESTKQKTSKLPKTQGNFWRFLSKLARLF